MKNQTAMVQGSRHGSRSVWRSLLSGILTVLFMVGACLPAGASEVRSSGSAAISPPVVESVSPPLGDVEGGAFVSIGGTGFSGGNTNVFFGLTPATIISLSDTDLTVVSPAHPRGTVPVVVCVVRCSSRSAPASFFTYKAVAAGCPAEPPRGQTYTALGDSYSAGEGLGCYIPGTDIPDVDQCHRSTYSYPEAILGSASRIDVSCSGAITDDVLSAFYQGEPPQIGSVSPGADTVTITIGGNDVGFASSLTACASLALLAGSQGSLAKAFPNVAGPQGGKTCQDWLTDIPTLASAMRARLRTVYSAILARMGRGAQLVVGTYPQIFPTTYTGQSIAGLGNGFCPAGTLAVTYSGIQYSLELGYTKDAVQAFSAGEAALNQAIKDAVSSIYLGGDTRIHLADVNGTPSQVQLHTLTCGDKPPAGADPWVNGVVFSPGSGAHGVVVCVFHEATCDPGPLVTGLISTASFHPTRDGQNLGYASTFAQALAGPSAPPGPFLTISPTSGPPGTVIATLATGCPPRSQGTISVFGGTGDQLLLQSRFVTDDTGTFDQTPLLPFPVEDSTGTLLPLGGYPVVLACGGRQAQATFVLTAAPVNPMLTISPTSGPPGTVISTMASGCPPRSPGTITVFGGANNQVLLQSSFITSDTGTFDQTPLRPFPVVDSTGALLPPGPYPVVLACGGQQVTATFELSAAPVDPMLTISPTSGPPGTVISNVATGCPPLSEGTITVFAETNNHILLQSTFRTDDMGSFDQTPLPPFPAVDSTGAPLPLGPYPVVLACGGQQVTVTFVLT